MSERPRNPAARADLIMPENVLVSDFDGTVTKNDFYALVSEQLLPARTLNFWSEYRAGRITHFQALAGYFAAIRADEPAVLRIIEQMQIDPRLAQSVAELRERNWRVVITSAGCRWYIDRLLREAGVDVEVHANPGKFIPGRGLIMELPKDSPFLSPTHGINKAAVVRHYLTAGGEVAFAGDGFPDVEAAALVLPALRFARGDLADVLTERKLPFRPFDVWSEIARQLSPSKRGPG